MLENMEKVTKNWSKLHDQELYDFVPFTIC